MKPSEFLQLPMKMRRKILKAQADAYLKSGAQMDLWEIDDSILLGPNAVLDITQALDQLGVALVSHNHSWTCMETNLYENAIALLKRDDT